MPASLVDVVMLDECRCRQHDVRDLRRLGHELFVHAHEEVLSREALVDQTELRCDHHRIRILDEHRGHRRPVAEGAPVTGEHRSDSRLIEHPDARVPHVEPFDERPVPVVDRAAVVERSAALVPPCARHRRDAEGRVHVDRPVALSGEPVAEPKEGPGGGADHSRERLDRLGRDPGDRGCPLGGPGREVGFELGRAVRVAREVLPVRVAVPKQHVHERARQRAVGPGPHAHQQVRLLRRRLPVHVDAHDLRAPLAPRLERVGHHVDLGAGRVGPPDDHEIGLRHLPRIGAGKATGPGDEAVPGKGGANGGVLARVAHRVAEPVDPVALYQPHRARVVVGPDGLRAVPVGRPPKGARHLVEGFVPPDRGERATRGTAERTGQTVRVMGPLGVARHLAADHPGGVVVRRRAAHPADPPRVEALDLQSAGRRAVVGTGAVVDLGRGNRVHVELRFGLGEGMIRHRAGGSDRGAGAPDGSPGPAVTTRRRSGPGPSGTRTRDRRSSRGAARPSGIRAGGRSRGAASLPVRTSSRTSPIPAVRAAVSSRRRRSRAIRRLRYRGCTASRLRWALSSSKRMTAKPAISVPQPRGASATRTVVFRSRSARWMRRGRHVQRRPSST